MKKRVLFDFDGTLVDSMGSVHRGVKYVFEKHGLPVPEDSDYVLNFRFPFRAYYLERGIRLSDKEILEMFKKGAGEYLPSFFDDAVRAVARLRDSGYSISVITANSEDNVLKALRYARLDDLIHCKTASVKTEAIRELVSKSSLGPKTVYVGDIIADIKDAKEAGAKPVAVLRNGLIRLSPHFHEAGAKICISSLDHLKL